jgi:hypothetical protein
MRAVVIANLRTIFDYTGFGIHYGNRGFIPAGQVERRYQQHCELPFVCKELFLEAIGPMEEESLGQDFVGVDDVQHGF